MTILPDLSMRVPAPPTLSQGAGARAADAAARNPELFRVAQDLEATFVSEMLKHAGFGEARGAFGGGAGEAQFASLLRDQQAQAFVARGGIGLAESLYDALVVREAAATPEGSVR